MVRLGIFLIVLFVAVNADAKRIAYIDQNLYEEDMRLDHCSKTVSMKSGIRLMNECRKKARQVLKPEDRRATVLYLETHYLPLNIKELQAKHDELSKLVKTARREGIDYSMYSSGSLPEKEMGELSAEELNYEFGFVRRELAKRKLKLNYQKCMTDKKVRVRGDRSGFCLDKAPYM